MYEGVGGFASCFSKGLGKARGAAGEEGVNAVGIEVAGSVCKATDLRIGVRGGCGCTFTR